jgi:hypothetical protein
MDMIDPKYLKDLKPPRALLDQCYRVLLTDLEEPAWRIKKWAREHCQSFVWVELVDTSDVGYNYDNVWAFYFSEEADKILFALTWI